MNYEQEIVELMPMLKNYLFKIEKKYNLYDTEDIFQECLCSAIESSREKNLKNPREYIIGIFDNTIKSHNRKAIREEQLFKDYWVEEKDKYSDPEYYPVINKIDERVKDEKDKIKRVWECMKVFKGSVKKTAEFLDFTIESVDYSKLRLRRIYKKVVNY
jgi:DNA-directed RNA polymerase specialized sigma24 family protein